MGCSCRTAAMSLRWWFRLTTTATRRGRIWFAGAAELPVGSGFGVANGLFGRMDVTGQRGRRGACDPGGRLDQVVRGGARAPRYRPVGPARDGARRARAQRGGEDHGGPDPDYSAAPRRWAS